MWAIQWVSCIVIGTDEEAHQQGGYGYMPVTVAAVEVGALSLIMKG